MNKEEVLTELERVYRYLGASDTQDCDYDGQEALEIAIKAVESDEKLSKVYVVIETQTGCEHEAEVAIFADEEKAIKYIEETSDQERADWTEENGTIYEGAMNYETFIRYNEEKIFL